MKGSEGLLRKLLYGQNDASRKFLLKVREVFEETGMKKIPRDESFCYCHYEKGVLEGMISSHVDDFILAGMAEFVEEITDKVKKKLDISKIEEGAFRFTGIDVQKIEDKIKVSMNDYANSLEVVNIRDGKRDEMLTKEEMKILRIYIGKLRI